MRRESSLLLISFVAFCVLTSLGVWQLKRLAWKQNLISHIHAQQHRPRIDLISEESSVFRRITTTGTFNYDLELRLVGRVINQRPGSYVFTPLCLEDGRLVYVNRGWVPKSISDQAVSRPSGRVRVEGVLKEKMTRTFFTPVNLYESRTIYSVQPQEIASVFKSERILPYYIDASAIHPQGTYPILAPQEIQLHNHHLLYAITWFALAGGLAIICFAYIRHRAKHSH